MKYPRIKVLIQKKQMLHRYSGPAILNGSDQLGPTVRSGLAQIKIEAAQTISHAISGRTKAKAVDDITTMKVLPSTSSPAISNTGSSSIMTDNEMASERLTVPKKVRFNSTDDTEEKKQPRNNWSLHYQCQICFDETKTYRNHLKHHLLFHSVKASRKQFVHFWLEPDVSDPRNTCRACERVYNNAAEYRHHLRHVHYMPVEHATTGRPKKTLPSTNNNPARPTFGPALDQFNLYCRPCRKRFQTAQKYKLHKCNMHDQPPIKGPNVLPDWNNPIPHCQSCDYWLSSREAYKRHCKTHHKINAKGGLDDQQQDLPDPLDPNHHCSVCNATSKDRASYRKHCRYRHAMDLAPANFGPNANTKLLPDPNDSSHSCRSCDKRFASKIAYWKHIRRVHKLKPKELSKSTALPDIYDPNNNCSTCNKTFAKRYLFNSHLRKVHAVTIPRKVPKKVPKKKNQ
ncbi:hypothetical protein MBANPS3_002550 [Mucor bainieri]